MARMLKTNCGVTVNAGVELDSERMAATFLHALLVDCPFQIDNCRSDESGKRVYFTVKNLNMSSEKAKEVVRNTALDIMEEIG